MPEGLPEFLRTGLTETIRVLLKTATSIINRLYNSSNIEDDARDTSMLGFLLHMNHFFEMVVLLQSSYVFLEVFFYSIGV